MAIGGNYKSATCNTILHPLSYVSRELIRKREAREEKSGGDASLTERDGLLMKEIQIKAKYSLSVPARKQKRYANVFCLPQT